MGNEFNPKLCIKLITCVIANCRGAPKWSLEAWTIYSTASCAVHWASLGRCRPSDVRMRPRITPMFKLCDVCGDCGSKGGRQETLGVTNYSFTRAVGTSGPSLIKKTECKKVTAEITPHRFHKKVRWFLPKVIWPPITNSDPLFARQLHRHLYEL